MINTNRLEMKEGRSIELEGGAIEIIQLEVLRTNIIFKKCHWCVEQYQKFNRCVIWVTERKQLRMGKKKKNFFEELIYRNFPKLAKYINAKMQDIWTLRS